MNLDDLSIARCAETYAVVLQPQFLAYGIEPIANLVTDLWIGVIKQTLHRGPHQSTARPQDVCCDGIGSQRIEWLPSSRHYQCQARDDAKAGPTVRQDMLPVCLKNQRVIPSTHPQQVPPEESVHDPGCQDQSHPVSQVIQGQPVPPLLGRGYDDASEASTIIAPSNPAEKKVI